MNTNADTDADTDTKQDVKKPHYCNSCNSCNKKLRLLSFSCRCGHHFCSAHLIPELHNCAFDYKGYGQSLIEKSNPKIKARQV